MSLLELSAPDSPPTTELLTDSQSTVSLPVSSIGRTNRKYLIGIHCILLPLFASVLEINCVMCDPTYKKKIADVVTQNFFFNE